MANNLFSAAPGEARYFPRFGGENSAQSSQLLRDVLTQLSGGVNNGFEPIAQKARQQFKQQTLPTLAERFTSLNASTSSPAFASQLGQAGQNFETDLAALGSQYQLQRNQQLMNLLNLLTPESIYNPREPGLLESIQSYAAPGITNYLTQHGNFDLGQSMPGQSNWQRFLGGAGKTLSAAAPLAALIPGWGPLAGAGLGLAGAGANYFSQPSTNKINQNPSFNFSWNPKIQSPVKGLA